MRRGRLLTILVVLLLALLLPPTLALGESVYNGYPAVLLLVDNHIYFPDVPGIIMDGRVLVPLRTVAEALGAKVDYNAEAHTVIIDGAPAHRIAALEAENQRLQGLVAAAGVQPVNGPVVFSEINTTRDQQGYTHVFGVARNVDQSPHSLLAVASFTSPSQKVMAVATGAIRDLAPGEGRPFELVTSTSGDLAGTQVTVQIDTLLPVGA